MSHEEKTTWALAVIAPAGYAAYLALAYLVGDGPLDPSTYVWPMVWAVLGAIVVGILVGIVIGIAAGASPHGDASRIDVRDKEIASLGSRVGNSFIVVGGMGALVLCFVQAHQVYIANTLYLCFVLAAILQSVTKLVTYRRGF